LKIPATINITTVKTQFAFVGGGGGLKQDKGHEKMSDLGSYIKKDLFMDNRN
jgi:hypothetical protein